MLLITVHDRRGPRTFSFASDIVTIGRDKERDLVLAVDGVSGLHAEVRVEDGAVWLVDRSAGHLRHDGQLIERVVPDPGEYYQVGDIDVRIRHDDLSVAAPDPREQAFLAALAVDPRDDTTRAVYADWLEEQGKQAHADFLRTQVSARGLPATDPAFAAASARLLVLARGVEVGWRARVAMAVVQACGERVTDRSNPIAFELECTRRWDEMLPTAVDGVRTCTACRKDVVYCTSLEQASGLAAEGGCIAVDVALRRRPGDLLGREHMIRGRPAPNVASRGTKPA